MIIILLYFTEIFRHKWLMSDKKMMRIQENSVSSAISNVNRSTSKRLKPTNRSFLISLRSKITKQQRNVIQNLAVDRGPLFDDSMTHFEYRTTHRSRQYEYSTETTLKYVFLSNNRKCLTYRRRVSSECIRVQRAN